MDYKILGVNDNASLGGDFGSVKMSLRRMTSKSQESVGELLIPRIENDRTQVGVGEDCPDYRSDYSFCHLLWDREDIPYNFRQEGDMLFFFLDGVNKEYFIPKNGITEIISSLEDTLKYRMKQEFDIFKLKNIKFYDLQDDGSVEISYQYDEGKYIEPFFLYNQVEEDDEEVNVIDSGHISRIDYLAIQDTFTSVDFDQSRCKDISIIEGGTILQFSLDGYWMYLPFFRNSILRKEYIFKLRQQLKERGYQGASFLHFKRVDLIDIDFNLLHFAYNNMFENIQIYDGRRFVRTAGIGVKGNHSFGVIDGGSEN